MDLSGRGGKDCSGGALLLAVHGHDRLFQRTQGPLVADGEDLGLVMISVRPGDHLAARHQALAVGGGDEIELVLDGEHAGVGRVRGVAA